MTNSYRYVQRYRPSSQDRIPEVVAFVETTMPLLDDPILFGSDDKRIVSIKDALTVFIDQSRKTVPAGLGVNLDLFAGSGSENNVCRYDLCIGTDPGEIFIDFLGIQFGMLDHRDLPAG